MERNTMVCGCQPYSLPWSPFRNFPYCEARPFEEPREPNLDEVRPPEIRAKWCYGDYTVVFKKYYETDSSFAYHHLNEMIEHWTFKKGRTLQSEEMTELKRRIVLEDRHLWIKDTAWVTLCWWSRNGRLTN